LDVGIDGKRFVTTGNEHGLSTAETVFAYRTDGAAITGSYGGGDVADGQIVGRVTGPDTIELLFQCRTKGGGLLAGRSRGRVRLNAQGLTELHFDWVWLAGDSGGGTSSYVELR